MQSEAAREEVPTGVGVSDGGCDSLPGQPVLYGDGSEREVCSRENRTHRHLILLGATVCGRGEYDDSALGN